MSTDDEQLQEIKEWWKKYRTPLIAGVIIGASALIGTQAWTNHQQRQALSASAEYDQMQTEMLMGNTEALTRRGDYLIENYARTPYAALAALVLARVHVEQDDLGSAAVRLQWVVDNAKVPEMAHVARLRLARVIAADGRPDQALALLEGVASGAFAASYDEVRGDIYAETGRTDQARRAYRSALAELGFGAGSEVIQLKLDGLGAEG